MCPIKYDDKDGRLSGEDGDWVAIVDAARVHFARRAGAHLASNVEHKSEVMRHPRPHLAPIKFQIVFSPPVGAALGSLLNAVSSCTCESHFLLFLKLALRIVFQLRSIHVL